MLNKTKIICFDVDDTLYERSQPFIKACEEVIAPKFTIDWMEFFKKRNYYADVCFEDEASGKITKEQMYEFRVSKALEEFGKSLSYDEIMEFEARYAYYQHHITLSPGMDKMLDALVANDVLLGIVTNGPSQRQRVKITSLDLGRWIPENCWCISGDYDTCKPHKEMFELSEEKLEKELEDRIVGPVEFWYVGDNYTNDVIGPKSAGWTSIWYCTSFEAWKKHADDEIQPDFIVGSPEELIDLLEMMA